MNNLTAINLGYVVMSSAGVVVLVMVIGIITFLMYLLKSKFINFKDTIQIKKLMGAHYSQIILPFVITTNTLLII
jgi:cell division protein FtsX